MKQTSPRQTQETVEIVTYSSDILEKYVTKKVWYKLIVLIWLLNVYAILPPIREIYRFVDILRSNYLQNYDEFLDNSRLGDFIRILKNLFVTNNQSMLIPVTEK